MGARSRPGAGAPIPPPEFLVPGVSLLLAAATAPLLARRLTGPDWTDPPRADRHAQRAVSRAGGAAWLAAFLAGIAIAALAGARAAARETAPIAPSSGIAADAGLATLASLGISAALGAAAFALGRLDDRGRLGAGAKWILQTALLLAGALGWALASTAFASAPLAPEARGGPAPSAPLLALALLLALAVQTAVQTFDNLDAALGSVATAACLALALARPEAPFSLAALAAGGAACGTLLWNLPPARAYFGNAAGLALGTLLAFWVFARAWPAPGGGPAAPGARELLLPALPLLWPLADLAFVVAARGRRGVPPWTGGRDHTTHRLATRLGSDRGAAAALLLYAAASAGVALSFAGPR